MSKEFKENTPNFMLAQEYNIPEYPLTQRTQKKGALRSQIMKDNSSGINYSQQKKSLTNKVDMLKSNIFNDPEKADKNKEDSTVTYQQKKKNMYKENTQKLNQPKDKKNRFNKDDPVLFAKLKWSNDNLNLYFKDQLGQEKKPIERKMNEFYGKNEANKTSFRSKIEDTELFDKLLEQYKKENPKISDAKIKKKVHMFDYNQRLNNQENSKIQVKNCDSKEYKFLCKSLDGDINFREIQKAFRNKGLHIYGIKEDNDSVQTFETKKVVFNIKDHYNNIDEFNKKIDAVKNDLKSNVGYDIEKYEVKKKKFVYVF